MMIGQLKLIAIERGKAGQWQCVLFTGICHFPGQLALRWKTITLTTCGRNPLTSLRADNLKDCLSGNWILLLCISHEFIWMKEVRVRVRAAFFLSLLFEYTYISICVLIYACTRHVSRHNCTQVFVWLHIWAFENYWFIYSIIITSVF